MTRKFWIHADGDSVGVAVVDIGPRERAVGVFMDTGKEFEVRSRSNVPLGHKIALKRIKKGEEVMEYNALIGVATKAILPGDHVHVHNLKSLRWTKR